MNRVNIDQTTWFDSDAAIFFRENTYWDGRNSCSVNTCSQWEHEGLYRTKGGKWVLNRWSAWQGSRESYEIVDDATATAWLGFNKCQNDEEFSKLPEAIQTLVLETISSQEI